MKKIPTLFEREFANHRVVKVTDKVTPGMEWVLEGKGVATIKLDGACCAIIDGKLYKRYDAKRGKKPPVGAIPCCDPDPVTEHWPHWVTVDKDNPADKWFVMAFYNSGTPLDLNATYEAIGPHFQGNPYKLAQDVLEPHGTMPVVDISRTFAGIRKWLKENEVEGLVFWLGGEPRCKIKRTDFGFEWPVR